VIQEICVVSGIYPPEIGGPAKFASAFTNWAQKTNVKVSVITLTDKSSHIIYSNNIEIRKISRNHNVIIRYLITAFHIWRKLKNRSKIIANGCFIETYFASKLSRKKYIAKVPGDIVWERALNNGVTHSSQQEFQNAKLSCIYKIFRFLYSTSLRNAEQVIVPTEELKNVCIMWGVAPIKIHVIYNSVAIEIFKPKLMQKKFDVITVSRLVAFKKIEEIIQICCDLSLTLAIVGEGPEKIKLESFAKKLNANVQFFGSILQSDLPEYLNSAKVFVLNSIFEASSYALLEARSCGLIAVAKSKTGSEEVIRDNIDGFLTDELIGKDLKKCLNEIFKKDFNYSAFSNRAIKRTHTYFDMSKNFKRIYDLIIGY
jgi:glycosyltransferase involved in cell wall biosynthesis